ncbi:plasmid stabilization protein [Rouxiella silvae]|uniref:Plasmid stabilization protein n=1 Tax=Rouxiella silvae TaxID=1646373 RepID=A0AA41BXV9_9GAMM|nr:plasmid stabilization protein [Rouxiella silvae]MBF6638354.1 plasmid stabilization protein [Rouxiella silvae]ORJ21905.1 plasmid stabilization protein [Rouxiella silvae]
MATLTIRNLDDEVKDLLRLSAAKNGHSMEEEARVILRHALQGSQPSYGLGSRLQQRFSHSGGVELTVPQRSKPVGHRDSEG